MRSSKCFASDGDFRRFLYGVSALSGLPLLFRACFGVSGLWLVALFGSGFWGVFYVALGVASFSDGLFSMDLMGKRSLGEEGF